jgi:hypothetical protein
MAKLLPQNTPALYPLLLCKGRLALLAHNTNGQAVASHLTCFMAPVTVLLCNSRLALLALNTAVKLLPHLLLYPLLLCKGRVALLAHNTDGQAVASHLTCFMAPVTWQRQNGSTSTQHSQAVASQLPCFVSCVTVQQQIGAAGT